MNSNLGQPDEPFLAARLRDLDGDLTKSEAAIAQWLVLNETTLGLETGASIAAKTGVSEITVSRFLRRVGFKGVAALKEELLNYRSNALVSPDARYRRLLDGELGAILKREVEATLSIGQTIDKPEWARAVELINAVDQVYVTGFQAIRGLAEDTARRLSIVRGSVSFISAHDSALAEWMPSVRRRHENRCLILIDIAPYAREAEMVAKIAKGLGIEVVVVTDEINTWAAKLTPLVFYIASRTGAFIESPGPMAALLNILVHAVAQADPEKSKARIINWTPIVRDLGVF